MSEENVAPVEEKPFDFYTLGAPDPGAVPDNPEPTTDNEDPTGEPAADESASEGGEEVPVGKTPYTSEEIAELIREDGDIDTSRLSPEGQAVMKAMQKGFTPKLQEAAEARKELERIRQEIEAAKPKAQPRDIYEAYDQNPQEVLAFVNQEIARLANEDAYGNVAEIERLRDMKTDFYNREAVKYKETQAKQMESNLVLQEIYKAVPDIETKQLELKDFAINVMGFSEEELARETSPSAGMTAATTIKRINQAYTKFNAGKTAQSKATKPAPTKVEKPGQGFTPPKTNETADRIKSAKETGDWSSVFLNLEE